MMLTQYSVRNLVFLIVIDIPSIIGKIKEEGFIR